MRKLGPGEEIKISVSPEGDVNIKAVGIKGSGCKEVTRPFESLGDVVSDRPTAEMREEPISVQNHSRAGR